MIGKGPRFERETVIVFNEAESTASVWTASEIVYRRLRKQGYMPSQDGERHAVFEIPKAKVRLLKTAISEAERERRKQSGERLRQGRLSREGSITLGSGTPNGQE